MNKLTLSPVFPVWFLSITYSIGILELRLTLFCLSSSKFDEVFRVLEYVKGSMSLHLSEGLSDAYDILEVMVHNLKLLNKALNHPRSVPNTHLSYLA